MKSRVSFVLCSGLIFLVIVFMPIVLISLSREFPPIVESEPFGEMLEDISIEFTTGRSSEWQSVRGKFIKSNPRCEACGTLKDLNVHHIKPYHKYPELELDMSNLITLCRTHHYYIGHDPDGPWKPEKPSWSKWNVNVRADAKSWSKK